MRNLHYPLKAALLYGTATVLWVFGSSYLLSRLIPDTGLLALLEAGKGWAFACITTLLLFIVLRKWQLIAEREREQHDRAAAMAEQLQHQLQAHLTGQRDERARIASGFSIQHAALIDIARGSDLDSTLQHVLQGLCMQLDMDAAVIWWTGAEGGQLRCGDTVSLAGKGATRFFDVCRSLQLSVGEGLPGRVWAAGKPLRITDVGSRPASPRNDAAVEAGFRSAFAFPIRHQGRILAVIELFGSTDQAPDEGVMDQFALLGLQLGLFIELKRVEGAREGTLERLQQVQTIARMANWIWDATVDHVTWSDHAFEVIGFGREALGESFASYQKLIHADDLEKVIEHARRLLEGETLEVEHRVVLPDGEVRHIHVRAIPAYRHGRVTGGTGYIQDITAEKVAQSRLSESEQRFSLAFQQTPIPSMIVTLNEGRVLDFNAAFLDLSGFAAEEIAGQTTVDLGLWDDAERRRDVIERIRHQGQVQNIPGEMIRKGGDRLSITYHAVTIQHDGQQRLLVHVQDVTQQRRAEKALRASQERFSLAFQASPVASAITTASESRIIDVNDEFCRVFGFDKNTVIGATTFDLDIWLDAKDREEVIAGLRAGGGRLRRKELRLRTRNGDIRDIMLSVEQIELEGQPCNLSLVQDVTDIRRIEQRLKLSARALEQAAESVVITDSQHRIVSVNQSFTESTGYSAEEAMGKGPAGLLHLPTGRYEGSDCQVLEGVAKALNSEGYWEGELWTRHKSGVVYPELWAISTVEDESGQVTHHVGVANDITRYKRREERLQFLANHDSLTGLPNRKLFSDRVATAVQRAERNGTHAALLYMDLDRFKQINDTHGHQAGDALLKQVAKRMTATVRKTDTVARFGGDEFVILLEELKSVADAELIAGKLIKAIRAPMGIEGEILSVSTSAGIAMYPEHDTDVEELIGKADEALYEAKKAGRNNYRFYSGTQTVAAL